MDLLARLTSALTDRYRIEREVGAGGMATVYVAHDVRHDRQVAIKVLKPELAAVLGAERFVQEIRTTAALQHPHILPLFDSGAEGGFLYYVMPYVEGETLRSKLDRETQFGVDEAVRIAREVADALDYAHRHGVIHRDIKPENILLHDGRPMVADFGIALAVSAAAGGRMTETGLSLGTPHYMSPEQATAEKEITARSDVYSLGSVLYEMLTGNPPHTGASAQQIIMKIIIEPVAPVTQLRKLVPPNVAAAVAKSVEKLPADRFESAKAFADALGNPNFSTSTGTTGSAGVMHADGVSKRAFIATAVLAVLALGAAAVGWLRGAPNAEVSWLSIALPDSEQLSNSVNAYRLAVSRDGRQIAYVGTGSTAAATRLWIRRLDQLRAIPLVGTEGGVNPAFSPDGQSLAFVSGTPRALRKIAIAGGAPVTLTDSLVDLGGVSWGSDGYIYYDGHLQGDGLARVRETGGSPEVASMPDTSERYHNSPDALPNGRGVLINIARGLGTAGFDAGVVDTKTGKHRVLVRGAASARYAASGHLLYVTPDGTLMAVPFDADRLTLTGEAVPILVDVAIHSLGRSDVTMSANGLLVYASRAMRAGRELVWVSRDGAVTPVDTQWTPVLSFGRLALSPDGKMVAVGVSSATGKSQLWVKQLDRGPASKVADVGAGPSWSPDGKSIVFVSDRKIARVLADGSVLPTMVSTGASNAVRLGAPAYSPDGKWMIFNRGGSDIVGQRTDGDTTLVELVTGSAVEGRGTVSPDGRWLAYQSDESGRPEVYVRPFPDTKVTKRQVSIGGGANPRWSHDGRELFFVDDLLDLIAVPVTLAPTFAAGTPHRLFAAADFLPGSIPFDVSRDGRRFLMSRQAGRASPRSDELVIVQNFFTELKAKVKKGTR
jgi:eukaryotic-like serine/threonine-protein kinase